MNRAALRKRVERLERAFGKGIFDGDDHAEPYSEPWLPYRALDGTFTGIIRDGDAVAVRIARPLTFSRDCDGSWLIYTRQDDGRYAEIAVRDPVGCDVLDALFELTANPDDFDGLTIDADDDK